MTGDHQGRTYFCCATNSCHFFHWTNSFTPPPIRDVKPIVMPSAQPLNTNISLAPSNLTAAEAIEKVATNPVKASNDPVSITQTDFLKLTLASFDAPVNSTFRAWFGVMTSGRSSEVNKALLSFPASLRRFKPTVRMWEFDFELYPQFVAMFQRPPFHPNVTVEALPTFLSNAILTFMRRSVYVFV